MLCDFSQTERRVCRLLNLYQQPYDPEYPVICMDEKPYQLFGEARQPIHKRKAEQHLLKRRGRDHNKLQKALRKHKCFFKTNWRDDTDGHQKHSVSVPCGAVVRDNVRAIGKGLSIRSYCDRLFMLEREFKKMKAPERYKERQKRSKPLRKEFYQWAEFDCMIPRARPVRRCITYK